MAKHGGSVSSWQRKQEKKKQEKNKAARIAARDEKVRAQKTEKSVLEEISRLEKQYKNPEMMPHQVKSKFDRLNKELKLVREEAEKKPKPIEPNKPIIPAFKPLENPALSVYFDPIMNPYGAPPPGRPYLYHTRDGGHTLNLSHAGLPGTPLPPPQPMRSPNQPVQQHRDGTQQSCNGRRLDNRPSSSLKVTAPPRPPPPPPPPPASSAPRERTSQQQDLEKAPKVVKRKRHEIPALPPPSAAVERSRRNLSVDIWASTAEIEYEVENGESALEGVAPLPAISSQWWYRDTSHNTQGPFPNDQTKAWVSSGFFPASTLFAASPNGPWQPLEHLKALRSLLPATSVQPTALPAKKERASRSVTVQDRIAALKAEKHREARVDNDDESLAIQARIAALRNAKQNGAAEEEVSVQDSNSALRGQGAQHETASVGDTEGQLRETQKGGTLQNTIETIKNEPFVGEIVDRNLQDEELPLPPPPMPRPAQTLGDIPVYPVDIASLPLPPPSPPGQRLESMPTYHVDTAPKPSACGFETIPAYPIDDTETVALYPLSKGEEDQEIAYPGHDAYPVSDVYPTVPYPTDGQDIELETSNATEAARCAVQEPKRKRPKVDQDIVAFVPARLKKK